MIACFLKLNENEVDALVSTLEASSRGVPLVM